MCTSLSFRHLFQIKIQIFYIQDWFILNFLFKCHITIFKISILIWKLQNWRIKQTINSINSVGCHFKSFFFLTIFFSYKFASSFYLWNLILPFHFSNFHNDWVLINVASTIWMRERLLLKTVNFFFKKINHEKLLWKLLFMEMSFIYLFIL